MQITRTWLMTGVMIANMATYPLFAVSVGTDAALNVNEAGAGTESRNDRTGTSSLGVQTDIEINRDRNGEDMPRDTDSTAHHTPPHHRSGHH